MQPNVPAKFTARYEALCDGFIVSVHVDLVSDSTTKQAGIGEIASASGLKIVLDELTSAIESHLALLAVDKDELNRGLLSNYVVDAEVEDDTPMVRTQKKAVKKAKAAKRVN